MSKLFSRRIVVVLFVVSLLLISGAYVVAGPGARATSRPSPGALSGSGNAHVSASYAPALERVSSAGYDSALPAVQHTVFLTNGTVAACECFSPNARTVTSMIYDPGKGVVFVGDLLAGALVEISPSTNRVLTSVTSASQGGLPAPGSVEFAYRPVPGTLLVPVDGQPTAGLPYSSSARVTMINDSSLGGAGPGPFSVPGSEITGESFDPATGDLFVSEGPSNGVAVVSPANGMLLSTIPVNGPGWSVYDPNTGTVFVVCATGVCALAASNLSLAASIPVSGGGSGELTYDSATHEVFFVDPLTGNVSVISDSNDTVVATVPLFPAYASPPPLPTVAAAYDPVDSEVFVSDALYGVAGISDANDSVVATVPGTQGAVALAFAPAQDELFAGLPTGVVQVISGNASLTFATIPAGVGPTTAVYDGATDQVFVASTDGSGGGAQLFALSGANGTVQASVPLPPTLTRTTAGLGLAYDPGRAEIFLADPSDNALLVVSDSTDTVVATVPVASTPTGVAYDPQEGQIFVTDYGSNEVSVVNDTNLTTVATIAVCGLPTGIALDPASGSVFVVCFGDASVDVLSALTDTVVATVALPSSAAPWDASFNAALGEVFVDEAGGTGRLFALNASNDSLVAIFNTTSGSGYGLESLGPGVLVPGAGGWQVEVIDGSTGKLLGYLDAASGPTAVTVDLEDNTTFVANGLAGTVSVLSTTPATARLRVQAVGLPIGATWHVTIGYPGSSRSTTQTAVNFLVPTGLVPFVVVGPTGWLPSRVRGAVSSSSQAVEVTTNQLLKVVFGPVETLTFNESSLPKSTLYAGAGWSVNLTPVFGFGGPPAQVGATNGTTLSFQVPAGAVYRIAVDGPGSEYRALPSKGVVIVPFHALTKTVRFKLLTESVVFRETGLPAGTGWTVTLTAGTTPALTFPLSASATAGSGAVVFHLPVGTYNFTVAASDAETATPSSGSVSVLTAPAPKLVIQVNFA